MARVSYLVSSALLLALATCAGSQFFADLFQGFQPFVTSRPTLKQIYEQTTRRIKTDQNRGNYNRQTTTETTKSYENDRRVNPPAISIENEIDRRKTYNNVYTTTAKPKKNSSRFINGDKRDQATQSDFNHNIKEDYNGKINSINDYYTQKPRTTEYNYNNYFTTHNPLISRPGVKPAVVDNRPPITNRPVTKRPNYGTNPRPTDEDSIAFPDDDTGPEVIIGPDEDHMSAVEKKRYLELSERMCDKYKSLTTKAVQAIPLLPSPEPVSLNVTACAPTNVPLVVGGKVVGIKEFPHMALLGWSKLESGGYSWKCGGSLVSEQFVLTAAHCTYQDRDNAVVNGPPTAVQLGSSYLDDPGALVVRVAAVIRHPKYKQPRSYYDLAVVKMVNAVKFSEVIKPACLGVPPVVGKSVIATGWGRTEYGGDQSHELRSVSLPVWGMSRCRDVLGTSRKLPDGPSADSQLCAGEERGGKDTCQGDSGGPAQVQEGCIWRVVAVTSLGRSCGAAETPGLYAKVQRAFVASQVFGGQKIGGNSQDWSNNEPSGNNNGQNWNNNGQSSNNNGQNWNDNGQNSNNNGQNWNNNGQSSSNNGPSGSNNGHNWNNENKNGHNYGNNNNQNYGNSNGQNYGNNNGQDGYDNGHTNGNNNGNYGDNNQKYGGAQNTERSSFNRPRYTTTTARPENVNYNNNQNNYKDKPYNNGYNQDGQNYDARKPNNNGQNYDGDSSNSNYGNNNRQQSDYNNYNRGTSQNSYTTRRPNVNDSSGTRYNNNYNNNDTRQQNSRNEYTTRRTISSNGNNNSNYSNNNYNTQNSNNNNRDQSNNNSYYASNNGNNNRRPSDSYTVSRPWWL